MKAEELVAVWPGRWPRPDAYSTRNATSQVKHFGRFFEGVPIGSISRSDFRRFALEHPGAARYARTMLADAFDEGLVGENVGAEVRIQRKAKKAIIVPTVDQIRLLVDRAGVGTSSAEGGCFRRAILFSAYTGVREGELRALALSDLVGFSPAPEWRPTRVTIRYSLNREERLKEPKTEASVGTIALLGPARDALWHQLLASQWPRGSNIRPDRFWAYTRSRRQALWDAARRHSGVDIPWHSLRHFCATYLLNLGATVDDVALQLRCSVEEVRKTYGHPDRDKALGRLEEVAAK